ncbi:MBL fold metallo-hydrolase [Aquisphaera insulae]|uniref:MBL fold metallo-hydrolase n=1 Tax=Aquisphaera insulae TaxID=2712864 RepID=UPI0013ECA7C0|nr:MBL fold metallo-hydrolase [Aquisphaera insulae]
MTTGRALVAEIGSCRVSDGQGAYWWLGQHGFTLKLGATVCYLDAFLSDFPDRRVPPLIRPEDVTNADLVLGSHDHADHIDRSAWPAIAAASPRARFVVPALLRERIIGELDLPADRVLGVDVDRPVQHGGLVIRGVPAAHEFLDVDPETGLHPYLGFVVEGSGLCLYHAGDTCIYEGMQEILRRWSFDVAFLPINGRDARRLAAGCIGNMTYQEAVDLAGTIRPRLTVPTHFEMFAMNSENPRLFEDYARVKYPGLRVAIPRHGERVLLGG